MSLEVWKGIAIGVGIAIALLTAAFMFALVSVAKVDIGDEDDRWTGV